MTTQNLKLVLRRLDNPIVIMFAVANIFFVVVVAAFFGGNTPAPAVAATTPAPIILIATAPPVVPTPAAQVEQVSANVTRAAIVAYDAPDGRALGAIEAGRAYQVLASWGVEWLQADVRGSGIVWLRAADLLGVPGGLVDLQPTIAPRVIVVSVPAEAVPTPGYSVESAPAPSLRSAAVLDRQQWAMQVATAAAGR